MSGYRPAHPRLYRLWNLAVVLALIVLTLPLMAVIALALAVTQGPRNVFYFGPRLGRDQRLFHIVKFKTLRDEAAQVTRDRVLPADSRMETLLGRPLRDTRLDELPQLFNVLLGDMNMLGPRPVRPAIAAKCRATIPDYDIRFQVKPGLIGYTQALMPHGADKAIRARVNAMLCRRPVSLVQEVLFIAVTAIAVLRWSVRVAARGVRWALRGGRPAQKGLFPYGAEARIDLPGLSHARLRLVHMDGDQLCVETTDPLPLDGRTYSLWLWRSFRFCARRKGARCMAVLKSVEHGLASSDGRVVATYRYTMTYLPSSPLHRYLIDRYLLGGALVA